MSDYMPTCHRKGCWETSVEHGWCSGHLGHMKKKWSAKVYFIRMGDHIKIGYSSNVRQRMLGLKQDTRLPVGVSYGDVLNMELLATEEGGKDREAALHRKFSHLSALYDNGWRSEWFRAEPDLLDYIDALEVSRPRVYQMIGKKP